MSKNACTRNSIGSTPNAGANIQDPEAHFYFPLHCFTFLDDKLQQITFRYIVLYSLEDASLQDGGAYRTFVALTTGRCAIGCSRSELEDV